MKKIVLIIIAAGLMTLSSYSQEDVLRPKGRVDGSGSKSSTHPWALGLEGGLSYNKYGADLNWTDANGESTSANSVYNVFESLSGLSPHFGVFVDYDIDKTFGIHVKFLYNQFKYSNNSDGIVDFYDPTTFPSTYLGTEIVNLEVEDKFSFFSFDPSLRINANEQLYFLIGPSFNYGIGTRTNQFDFTKEDTGINFVGPNATSDNSSSISASEDFKSTRYGINLGAGYKFKVGNNVYLAPQINYNLDISSYNNQGLFNDNQTLTEGVKILNISNQSVNQIRFSVTLWFENL